MEKQAEIFKYMAESYDLLRKTAAYELSYSYIMRKLRKADKDVVRQFQEVFKKNFDAALDDNLENPEKIALLAAIKETKQTVKNAALDRMIKTAEIMTNLGDPAIAGRYIADIVRFLMSRADPKLMSNLRSKISKLNSADIASKEMTEGAAIGQSITFVKNILMGQNPAYVSRVLYNVLINL